MNIIETTLQELGVPAELSGFRYLADAVELAMADPAYTQKITGLLYPSVGAMNHIKPASAERCMRVAIEAAFIRNKPATVEKYFGESIRPDKGKPTNSQFVATVALHLKGVRV